ncbi:hypothetical protein T265_09570 [Opisthorchis viverrini]|uniref:Uncharacterized protein n=1 Tax=Opisthorchis viverrini TaxID=6198 RepID=A0A074Z9S7_OPIVI|nr:hypothetical protein T265_09570 [Opisthorchis viverrini]KER22327.1 hypothetical protein T265_09570 [Opisthorchis viverrini]
MYLAYRSDNLRVWGLESSDVYVKIVTESDFLRLKIQRLMEPLSAQKPPIVPEPEYSIAKHDKT